VWRAFTQHRIRAGLAVLVVGIGLFGLGIAACAFHVCAAATTLIDSASQIRTTADAECEIASWKKNMGTDSWAESDDSGRGGNYSTTSPKSPSAPTAASLSTSQSPRMTPKRRSHSSPAVKPLRKRSQIAQTSFSAPWISARHDVRAEPRLRPIMCHRSPRSTLPIRT
jgi:threonine dehydrogenase-like Zn-dependent dehydrogenase